MWIEGSKAGSGWQGRMKWSVLCCRDGDVVDDSGDDGDGFEGDLRGGKMGRREGENSVLDGCEFATCVSDKRCESRAWRETHKSSTL